MAQSNSDWKVIGKLSVKEKSNGQKYFAGKITGKNGKDVQVCVIKKDSEYLLYKKA